MTPNGIWEIGLSSWIVQDGNFSDFEAGQEYAFALEFYCPSLTRGRGAAWIKRTGPGQYAWNAQVLMVEAELTILEAQIRCYREMKPKIVVKAGDYLAGEVRLGVDPFFWMENHAHREGLPSLIYRWRIQEVLLETTPWISSQDESGRTCLSRSADPPSFRSIKRTDAWSDDSGRAEYLLHCELLGIA